MAKIKKVATAAGTFGVALGIGFVMQNGDALASRFGGEGVPNEPAPFSASSVSGVQTPVVLSDATDGLSVPAPVDPIAVAQGDVSPMMRPERMNPEPAISTAVIVPEIARLPDVQAAPVQLAALATETPPSLDDAQAGITLDCTAEMVALAGSAASVDLSVTAPCHANTPFTVHHQGMMFTAMTNDDGISNLTVPALAEVAVMISSFDDGEGAVTTVVVPDFAEYDRAVLQWQGETSVMLSAYEDGAKFGDQKHIFAGNPGDVDRLESAEGGYLMRLGDATVGDGLVAEVYSFPSGMLGDAHDVILVAEAEITDGNCGHELSAQSIQVSPNGATSALDLNMIMPECEAVGDILILQNMFEDLTIASR